MIASQDEYQQKGSIINKTPIFQGRYYESSSPPCDGDQKNADEKDIEQLQIIL